MNVFEWLIFGPPWWAQIAFGAILVGLAVIALVMTLGREKTLKLLPWIGAALLLVVTLGLVNKFKQEGWQAKVERDKREADKMIDRLRKEKRDNETDARKEREKGSLDANKHGHWRDD